MTIINKSSEKVEINLSEEVMLEIVSLEEGAASVLTHLQLAILSLPFAKSVLGLVLHRRQISHLPVQPLLPVFFVQFQAAL